MLLNTTYPLAFSKLRLTSVSLCLGEPASLSSKVKTPVHGSRSPLAGKSSALNLAQSLGAAKERHGAEKGDNGQGLKQVPGAVVKEEGSLNGKDGSKEDGVRDRRSTEGLGDVVDVGTQSEPLQ